MMHVVSVSAHVHAHVRAHAQEHAHVRVIALVHVKLVRKGIEW